MNVYDTLVSVGFLKVKPKTRQLALKVEARRHLPTWLCDLVVSLTGEAEILYINILHSTFQVHIDHDISPSRTSGLGLSFISNSRWWSFILHFLADPHSQIEGLFGQTGQLGNLQSMRLAVDTFPQPVDEREGTRRHIFHIRAVSRQFIKVLCHIREGMEMSGKKHSRLVVIV